MKTKLVSRLATACCAACSFLTALAASQAAAAPKPELLVALPDYCNTPDGMALLKDGSIVVSVPNFNDKTRPPLFVRVTPERKVEKFFEIPTPYPGQPAGFDRIGPMGVMAAPNGDLFFADMQDLGEQGRHSRLWKLTVKNGRADKMVLVADGFNIANGLAIRGGFLYVTESVLEKDSKPLISGVLRFRLDEEGVRLTTPLKDDPHVLTTFTCKDPNVQWPFGADGIDFDSKGNLYVGSFGDGKLYRITFDESGKVTGNKLFAEVPGRMINCDGMRLDPKTDKLYVADSAANAVQVIDCADGSVTTLVANDDVADKLTGGLDQPCEALVRGDEIIVSNMDWPFPGFKNQSHQLPATLSVIRLK
jgi:sugar lactone lactonase YvrE